MRVIRLHDAASGSLSFQLLDDAEQPVPAVAGFLCHLGARGWPREVERHQCAAARIEQLLAELGERVEEPTAVAEHRVPGQ